MSRPGAQHLQSKGCPFRRFQDFSFVDSSRMTANSEVTQKRVYVRVGDHYRPEGVLTAVLFMLDGSRKRLK